MRQFEYRSTFFTNCLLSLELNIHQRILSDIASNDGSTFGQQLLSSRVQTRADVMMKKQELEKIDDDVDPGERFESVYMVCIMLVSRVPYSFCSSSLRREYNVTLHSATWWSIFPIHAMTALSTPYCQL